MGIWTSGHLGVETSGHLGKMSHHFLHLSGEHTFFRGEHRVDPVFDGEGNIEPFSGEGGWGT